MPFTKHKELLIKAEQKLSGKDTKKLVSQAPTAVAELLSKKGADIVQRKTAGGLVCRIIDVDKLPILFEFGNAGLLPTLPAMWKKSSSFLCVPEV